MGRMTRRLAALLAVTVLAVTACGSGDSGSASSDGSSNKGDESGQPTPGGDITWLTTGEPVSLDSKSGPSVYAGIYLGIYDRLMHMDSENEVVTPGMAESLTDDSGDATEWTLKLRPDVQFSDGTPLNAEAVKFNWDRYLDPATAAPVRATLASFTGWKVVDDLTLSISIPYSRADLPNDLATTSLGLISSPAAVKAAGESYGTSPETTVGAGPFVVAEWQPGDHITLKKNAEYWDSKLPYLDSVTFKPVGDPAQQADAVLTGAADVGWLASVNPEITRLRDAGMSIFSAPPTQVLQITFNSGTKPFEDERVRKAIALATDLDKLSENVQQGLSSPAHTWYAESSPYFNKDVVQKTNDLEAGQALIDDYLKANGGQIKFTFVANEATRPLSVAIQQQWSRLDGVEVELEVLQTQAFLERRNTSEFQAILSTSPQNTIDGFFQMASTNGGQNWSNISDPALDKVLEESRALSDPEEKKAAFTEITSQILDKQYWLPIEHFEGWTIATPKVHGIEMFDFRQGLASSAWLEK
ncbi:MAG: ABC transporter substrate-binding protein [Microthrixaceae bacterium]